MAMLFKLTDNSVLNDNPDLKAIEGFRNLSEKELRFVILYCDWGGKLRRLPKEERKDKALRLSGFTEAGKLTDIGTKILKDKDKKIVAAIKLYNELQGWSEAQIIEGIDVALGRFNKELKGPATPIDDIIKISKSLPDLLKKRKEIMNLIEDNGVDEEEVIEEDVDESVSRLDEINGG